MTPSSPPAAAVCLDAGAPSTSPSPPTAPAPALLLAPACLTPAADLSASSSSSRSISIAVSFPFPPAEPDAGATAGLSSSSSSVMTPPPAAPTSDVRARFALALGEDVRERLAEPGAVGAREAADDEGALEDDGAAGAADGLGGIGSAAKASGTGGRGRGLPYLEAQRTEEERGPLMSAGQGRGGTTTAGEGSRPPEDVRLGPLPRPGVVRGPVRLVLVRDGADERVGRVGVRQQAAEAQHDLLQRQRRRPRVLEDVEADGARLGNVAVIDLGREL